MLNKRLLLGRTQIKKHNGALLQLEGEKKNRIFFFFLHVNKLHQENSRWEQNVLADGAMLGSGSRERTGKLPEFLSVG